jgi:hypothetical protein
VTVDLKDGTIIAGDARNWNRTIQKVILAHSVNLMAFWDATRPDDQKLEKKLN